MESGVKPISKDGFASHSNNLTDMLLTEPWEVEQGLNYVHRRKYLDKILVKPWLKVDPDKEFLKREANTNFLALIKDYDPLQANYGSTSITALTDANDDYVLSINGNSTDLPLFGPQPTNYDLNAMKNELTNDKEFHIEKLVYPYIDEHTTERRNDHGYQKLDTNYDKRNERHTSINNDVLQECNSSKYLENVSRELPDQSSQNFENSGKRHPLTGHDTPANEDNSRTLQDLPHIVSSNSNCNGIHINQSEVKPNHCQTINATSIVQNINICKVNNAGEEETVYQQSSNQSKQSNMASLSSTFILNKVSPTRSELVTVLNDIRPKSGLVDSKYATLLLNSKSSNIASSASDASNDAIKSSVDLFILANTKRKSTLNSFSSQHNRNDSNSSPYYDVVDKKRLKTPHNHEKSRDESSKCFNKSDAMESNGPYTLCNSFGGDEETHFMINDQSIGDSKDLNSTFNRSDSLLSDLLKMEILTDESAIFSQVSPINLDKQIIPNSVGLITTPHNNEHDDTIAKNTSAKTFSENYSSPSGGDQKHNLPPIASSQDKVATHCSQVMSLAQCNPLDAFVYIRTGKRKLDIGSKEDDTPRNEKCSYPPLKVGSTQSQASLTSISNKTVTLQSNFQLKTFCPIRLICSTTLANNGELTYLLEARYNINFVERNYDLIFERKADLGRLFFADMIVDEATALTICTFRELKSSGDVMNLQRKLYFLMLKYVTCWVVIYNSSSSSMSELSSSSHFLTMLSIWTSQISYLKVNLKVKIIFCIGEVQVAAAIRQIIDATLGNNQAIDQEQRQSCDWILPEVSAHEKFLLSYGCINSFTAQLMLGSMSLEKLLQSTLEELCPKLSCVPSNQLKLFHAISHWVSPIHGGVATEVHLQAEKDIRGRPHSQKNDVIPSSRKLNSHLENGGHLESNSNIQTISDNAYNATATRQDWQSAFSKTSIFNDLPSAQWPTSYQTLNQSCALLTVSPTEEANRQMNTNWNRQFYCPPAESTRIPKRSGTFQPHSCQSAATMNRSFNFDIDNTQCCDRSSSYEVSQLIRQKNTSSRNLISNATCQNTWYDGTDILDNCSNRDTLKMLDSDVRDVSKTHQREDRLPLFSKETWLRREPEKKQLKLTYHKVPGNNGQTLLTFK